MHTPFFLHKVCQITLQFTVNKSIFKGRQDVDILQDLVSVISRYSSNNNNMESLMVTQFTRDRETISLTYSNCTWIQNLERGVPTDTYLQAISRVLEQYFLMTQTTVVGMSSGFKNYLETKGFEYRSVMTTYGCTKPPNPPPSRIKDLDFKIETPCGDFEILIPEDTFMDRKYGNSRQLLLELFLEDGVTRPDWIALNSRQGLYGMINKRISESQPSSGYRFVLKATNPVGQSSTTTVIVRLPKNKRWIVEHFKIIVATIPSQEKENRLHYQVALIKRIQEYPAFVNTFQGKFYVQELISGSFGDLVRLSYCEQCNGLNYLKARSLQIPSNQQDLIQHLSKGFNIQGSLFIELPTKQQLTDECQGIPYPTSAPTVKNIRFCPSSLSSSSSSQAPSTNVWNLEDDFTPLIEDFSVFLLNEDNSPLPQESWINLVSKPYRVVSFPTRDIWSRQPTEKGYRLKVVLRDPKSGRVVGVPSLFAFKILGPPQVDGLKYTLVLSSLSLSGVSLMSDAALIYDVWTRVGQYFGEGGGEGRDLPSLQHVSLKRENLNTKITWLNCSLPKSCRGSDVDSVNDLFKKGLLNPDSDLARTMSPNYQLVNVTAECTDNPPVVQPQLNLTVPRCGFSSYKLPDNFATDENDEKAPTWDKLQLKVELFNADGITRPPRSSWISYSSVEGCIEAVPDDSTVQIYDRSEGLIYTLRVTDSKGKYSTSKLTVHLKVDVNEPQKGFLSYSLSFKSFYATTVSFIELKKTILENFAAQASRVSGVVQTVDMYRVGSMTLVDQQQQLFVIRLVDCSISQYTCPNKYQNVVQVSDNLVNSNGLTQLTQQTSLQTGGKIVINSIVKSLETSVNRPPLIVNLLRQINVTYCDNGAFKIPKGTFTKENGDIVNYKLFSIKNGAKQDEVSSQSWVNIVNDMLYISPLTSTQPGVYKFIMEARDQCNLKAETELSVVLSGDSSPSPHYLVMQFKYKSIQQNYAKSILNIRTSTMKCSHTEYNNGATLPDAVVRGIRADRFTYDDSGYMRFQYSLCSVKKLLPSCIQQDLDRLTGNIFSSPNVVAETFKQCFRPECELLQATEFRVDECKPKSPPPRVALQPVFNTTFCRKATFRIDRRTFADETGLKDARSMNLELLTETFDALPKTEWIQFDTFQQEIYGYPRTGDSSKLKTSFRYVFVFDQLYYTG